MRYGAREEHRIGSDFFFTVVIFLLSLLFICCSVDLVYQGKRALVVSSLFWMNLSSIKLELFGVSLYYPFVFFRQAVGRLDQTDTPGFARIGYRYFLSTRWREQKMTALGRSRPFCLGSDASISQYDMTFMYVHTYFPGRGRVHTSSTLTPAGSIANINLYIR